MAAESTIVARAGLRYAHNKPDNRCIYCITQPTPEILCSAQTYAKRCEGSGNVEQRYETYIHRVAYNFILKKISLLLGDWTIKPFSAYATGGRHR